MVCLGWSRSFCIRRAATSIGPASRGWSAISRSRRTIFCPVLNVHKAAGLPLRNRQMVPANSIHSSEASWSSVVPVGRVTGQAVTTKLRRADLATRAQRQCERIRKTGHHMFKTKTLMVIIFILGSAVAVKAGVFYSFGMPGPDYMLELTDPRGFRNKNPALGGVSGKSPACLHLLQVPPVSPVPPLKKSELSSVVNCDHPA
jgi:hypothetical protein